MSNEYRRPCGKCGGEEYFLFSSWVCDHCQPPKRGQAKIAQEEARASYGFQYRAGGSGGLTQFLQSPPSPVLPAPQAPTQNSGTVASALRVLHMAASRFGSRPLSGAPILACFSSFGIRASSPVIFRKRDGREPLFAALLVSVSAPQGGSPWEVHSISPTGASGYLYGPGSMGNLISAFEVGALDLLSTELTTQEADILWGGANAPPCRLVILDD